MTSEQKTDEPSEKGKKVLISKLFSLFSFLHVHPFFIVYPLEGQISMTTLLTHTVAHSTKPSFRPKTNNQPLKKFLGFVLS